MASASRPVRLRISVAIRVVERFYHSLHWHIVRHAESTRMNLFLMEPRYGCAKVLRQTEVRQSCLEER
jgi:hypothetical protein